MPCHPRKSLFIAHCSLFIMLVALFLVTPAYADWIFDATPPTCDINVSAGTSYPLGSLTSVIVWANDASGISSLSLTATSLPASTSVPLPSPTPSPAACPYGSCTYQTQTYNWTPPEGSYRLTPSAVDNNGNPGTAASCPPVDFTVGALYLPWIKTTGGDVHSNTGINASGGP